MALTIEPPQQGKPPQKGKETLAQRAERAAREEAQGAGRGESTLVQRAQAAARAEAGVLTPPPGQGTVDVTPEEEHGPPRLAPAVVMAQPPAPVQPHPQLDLSQQPVTFNKAPVEFNLNPTAPVSPIEAAMAPARAQSERFRQHYGQAPAQVSIEEGTGPGRAIVTTGRPLKGIGQIVPALAGSPDAHVDLDKIVHSPKLQERIAARLAAVHAPEGYESQVPLKGSIEEELTSRLHEQLGKAPEMTGAAARVGKASYEMATHPISTITGAATFPLKSGKLLGGFTRQELERAAAVRMGAEPPERTISPRDAGWAAGQLLAIGAVGQVQPMLEGMLGRGAGRAITEAIKEGRNPSRAILSGYLGAAIATRTAGTAAVGATYAPDDPVVGAAIGAMIGGAHAVMTPLRVKAPPVTALDMFEEKPKGLPAGEKPPAEEADVVSVEQPEPQFSAKKNLEEQTRRGKLFQDAIKTSDKGALRAMGQELQARIEEEGPGEGHGSPRELLRQVNKELRSRGLDVIMQPKPRLREEVLPQRPEPRQPPEPGPTPSSFEQAADEARIRQRAEALGHDPEVAIQLYRDELEGKAPQRPSPPQGVEPFVDQRPPQPPAGPPQITTLKSIPYSGALEKMNQASLDRTQKQLVDRRDQLTELLVSETNDAVRADHERRLRDVQDDLDTIHAFVGGGKVEPRKPQGPVDTSDFETTTTTAEENPRLKTQEDSRYAGEDNPEELLNASRDQAQQHWEAVQDAEASIERAREKLKQEDLSDSQRNRLERGIAETEKKLGGLRDTYEGTINEISNAFGEDEAHRTRVDVERGGDEIPTPEEIADAMGVEVDHEEGVPPEEEKTIAERAEEAAGEQESHEEAAGRGMVRGPDQHYRDGRSYPGVEVPAGRSESAIDARIEKYGEVYGHYITEATGRDMGPGKPQRPEVPEPGRSYNNDIGTVSRLHQQEMMDDPARQGLARAGGYVFKPDAAKLVKRVMKVYGVKVSDKEAKEIASAAHTHIGGAPKGMFAEGDKRGGPGSLVHYVDEIQVDAALRAELRRRGIELKDETPEEAGTEKPAPKTPEQKLEEMADEAMNKKAKENVERLVDLSNVKYSVKAGWDGNLSAHESIITDGKMAIDVAALGEQKPAEKKVVEKLKGTPNKDNRTVPSEPIDAAWAHGDGLETPAQIVGVIQGLEGDYPNKGYLVSETKRVIPFDADRMRVLERATKFDRITVDDGPPINQDKGYGAPGKGEHRKSTFIVLWKNEKRVALLMGLSRAEPIDAELALKKLPGGTIEPEPKPAVEEKQPRLKVPREPKRAIDTAETGVPFEATLWRGEGRETSPYNEMGAQVPILGPGRYTTNNKEYAAEFGPNLSEVTVRLENPIVIDNDAQWRTLTTERAGWAYPNPFGQEPKVVEADIDRLREYLESKGFDGAIIRGTFRETTGKTLGKVFGANQVVEFTKAKPVAKAERPEEPAAPPAEEKPKLKVPEETGTTAVQRSYNAAKARGEEDLSRDNAELGLRIKNHTAGKTGTLVYVDKDYYEARYDGDNYEGKEEDEGTPIDEKDFVTVTKREGGPGQIELGGEEPPRLKGPGEQPAPDLSKLSEADQARAREIQNEIEELREILESRKIEETNTKFLSMTEMSKLPVVQRPPNTHRVKQFRGITDEVAQSFIERVKTRQKELEKLLRASTMQPKPQEEEPPRLKVPGEESKVQDVGIEEEGEGASPADLEKLFDAALIDMKALTLPRTGPTLRSWAAKILGRPYESRTWKMDDLYDVIEIAVNRLASDKLRMALQGDKLKLEDARALEQTWFKTRLRSIGMQERQQFSTPLPIARAAQLAAGVGEHDKVLEPTAGTGNLVNGLPSMLVTANEIDPRRAALLKLLGYDPTTTDALKIRFNGKRYNVVIMNPPFGSAATGKYSGLGALPFTANDVAERFVYAALQSLIDGGRLVAIMPKRVIDQGTGFNKWLRENHSPVAYIESPPGAYSTRGTDIDTVMLVVDKGQGPGAGPRGTEDPLVVRAPSWEKWETAIERFMPKGDLERISGREEAVDVEPTKLEEKPETKEKTEAALIDRTKKGEVAEEKPPKQVGGHGAETGAGNEAGSGLAPRPGGKPPEPTGAGGATGVQPQRPPSGPGGGVEAGQPGHPPVVAGEGPGDTDAGGGSEETKLVLGVPRRRVEPQPGDSRERKREIEAANASAVFTPYATGLGERRNPHPRLVVETRSMAGIPTPPINEKSAKLKSKEVEAAWGRSGAKGGISDEQMDVVQRALTAWGKGHGFLAADDVGVGKTREAAALVLEAIARGATRIVYTTKNDVNLSDAQNEFRMVASGAEDGDFPATFVNIGDYTGVKKGNETLPAPNGPVVYFATSYNFQVEQFVQALIEVKPTVWIADEAHEFKNQFAGRGINWRALHADMLERGSNQFAYFTATPAVTLDELGYLYGLKEWPIGGFSDWVERKLGLKAEGRGEGDEEAAELSGKDIVDMGDRGEDVGNAKDSDRFAKTGKKKFMRGGSDVFNQRVTPAETEQIMRELKGAGKYVARDLWRGGVKFEVMNVPLAADSPAAKKARERYDIAAELARDIVLAGRKYGRMNKQAKAAGLDRAMIQSYMKQLLFTLRLPTILDAAEKALEQGKQVVISVHSVTGDEDLEEGLSADDAQTPVNQRLHSAINRINTREVKKGGKGEAAEFIDLGEIPEALQARAELLDRAAALEPLPDPVRAITDRFGARDVAVITGQRNAKQRKQAMGEFQSGKKPIAIISKAGKIGISLHDVNDAPRHMIVGDYEWSADTFKQELGRVDRTGQKSSPTIVLAASDLAAERKFAATIAARMASLGATSKGSAESTGTDALDQFDVSDGVALDAMRNAVEHLPDSLRDYFTGSKFLEWTRIGRNEEELRAKRRPDDASIKNFLLEMMMFPVEAANTVYDRWMAQRDYLRTGETEEIAAARRTARGEGVVRRRTLLTNPQDPPMALVELDNKAGERRGILQGFVTPYISEIQDARGQTAAGATKTRRYVAVTTPDGELVTGLELSPGEIRAVKRIFGKGIRKSVTPEEAWLDLQAGDNVPIQGPKGSRWVLHPRGKDGRIQIQGATLAKHKDDLKGYAKYETVGNYLFISPDKPDVIKFLERFPPVQPEGGEGEGGGGGAKPAKGPTGPSASPAGEPGGERSRSSQPTKQKSSKPRLTVPEEKPAQSYERPRLEALGTLRGSTKETVESGKPLAMMKSELKQLRAKSDKLRENMDFRIAKPNDEYFQIGGRIARLEQEILIAEHGFSDEQMAPFRKMTDDDLLSEIVKRNTKQPKDFKWNDEIGPQKNRAEALQLMRLAEERRQARPHRKQVDAILDKADVYASEAQRLREASGAQGESEGRVYSRLMAAAHTLGVYADAIESGRVLSGSEQRTLDKLMAFSFDNPAKAALQSGSRYEAPTLRKLGGLRSETQATPTPPPDMPPDQVKSLMKISKRLAEMVDNLPLAQGRGLLKRRKAAGAYWPDAESIRVRRFDMTETVAHEVGHHISKKYLANPTQPSKGGGTIKLTKAQRTELVKMGRDLYGSRKPQGGYGEEGIAQWFRFYVADPKRMVAEAPSFTQVMETQIFPKEPALKKALDIARADLEAHEKAPFTARMDAMIDVAPAQRWFPDARTMKRWFIDDLYEVRNAVEDLQAMGGEASASKNAYILSRLTRGGAGMASEMIERGIYIRGKRVTKGISEILGKLEPEDFQPLRRYIVGERVLEAADRGIDTGFRLSDARAAVAAYKAKYGSIAQDLWDVSNALIDYRVWKGVLTPEEGQAIKDNNRKRVGFYRVFDENEAAVTHGTGGKGFRSGSGIKRLVGSARDIVDPLESIMADVYSTVQRSHQAEVLEALVKHARKTEGGARVLDVLTEIPKTRVLVRADEIKAQLAQLGFIVPNAGLSSITGMVEAFVPKLEPSGKEAKDLVLPVVINGRRMWVQFRDRRLYDTLLGLGTPELPVWARWLSLPTRTLRAGATLSLQFIGRNPVRDAVTAAVWSAAGNRPPGWDFVRGFWHVINQDKLYQEWRLEGGDNASMLGLDRPSMRRHLGDLYRQAQGKTAVIYSRKEFLRVYNDLRNRKENKPSKAVAKAMASVAARGWVLRPIDWLRMLSSVAENATRVGEYEQLKRTLQKDPTLTNRDVKVAATLGSRDVTIDFARAGTIGRQVNMLYAFVNANIQGWDKLQRELRHNPKTAIPRILAWITIPSLLLYLWQKDDPIYQDVPLWQKSMNWIIVDRGPRPTSAQIKADLEKKPQGYVPTTYETYANEHGPVEHIWRIPKPPDLGVVFGTTIERMAEWVHTKDPKALDKFMTSMEPLSPVSYPYLPNAFQGLAETWANKNIFTGAPIEPEGLEQLPPGERATSRTGEAARQLGQTFNISPAKTENLIRTQTGGVGEYAMDLADIMVKNMRKAAGAEPLPAPAAPTSKLTVTPFIRGFAVRVPEMDAQSIKDALDTYSRAEALRQEFLRKREKGDIGGADRYFKKHEKDIRSVASTNDDFGESDTPPDNQGVLREAHQIIIDAQRLARDADEATRKEAAAIAVDVARRALKGQPVDADRVQDLRDRAAEKRDTKRLRRASGDTIP